MEEHIYNINNIRVKFEDFEQTTDEMAKAAIDYAEQHKEKDAYVISSITITKDGNEANFDVKYNDDDQPKFARFRRITGYLTGTTDRLNSSKKAELENRVTHL